MTRYAVICANGLGDALLSMIVSHNLYLSGYSVTTFSTPLTGLKEWFPSHTILPFPPKETLYSFDTIIAADHAFVTENDRFGNALILLKEDNFDRRLTMVENLQKVCEKRLSLPIFHQDNGIVVPDHLNWRTHRKRIVIHPMSTDPRRMWPPAKFLSLAKKLELKDFFPVFCVSPSERAQWVQRVEEKQLPLFSSLYEIASFIYESGGMIGNNSGIGHLASLFHIPTLSLFARKSYSNLWRPGWGPGKVITPPLLLLGSHLKQKYWKQLLSVNRVLNAFKKLGVER